MEDIKIRIGSLSDSVAELITTVKSEKAEHLFFMNNMECLYLDRDSKIDHFKKIIMETNSKINKIVWANGFSRDITEPERIEDYFKFELTESEFDKYTGYWYDEIDLRVFKERYLNYGEDADKEIKLPKFQLITDYLALLEYYDKLNERLTELKKGDNNLSKFDSSDETNPLIFDRNLISGLHNNFRNFIFKTTDIDTFENYFREKPLKIEKKDGISISVICYLFGKIEPHQNGVENFARWMKNHIGKTNYGSKKKEFIEMAESAKIKRGGFSLTAPQEKALQNKEKIDVLLNRMNPDL